MLKAHTLPTPGETESLIASHVIARPLFAKLLRFFLVFLLTGNRMFSFDGEASDFYLAQLINIYIHMPETAEAIHPYIVHRFEPLPKRSLRSNTGSFYTFECVPSRRAGAEQVSTSASRRRGCWARSRAVQPRPTRNRRGATRLESSCDA